MKKPTFLERLTGTIDTEEYDDVLAEEHELNEHDEIAPEERGVNVSHYDEQSDWNDEIQDEVEQDQQEGELPVDMYQTGEAIVIRALVAGVAPGDLDISITRDMVKIRGTREEYQESHDDDYYHRELFWGSFSRTLLLPEEVLIDEAEAQEKHGLLEITLPKVDKDRSTRLKVKTGGK